MNENEMREFADALWAYFKDRHLIPYLSDSVCYYTATVTTAPSGGVIGVQRPYDVTVTIPYAWSAANLQTGDRCTVLVFGDSSNAIAIGDGSLSEKGIDYTLIFNATTDWTGSGPYSISLPATTHGCGSDPNVDVLTASGTSYIKFYGYPSEGWKISIDSNGNITLTTGVKFAGKIKVHM